MNFYWLVIEELAGNKYPMMSTFCSSIDDISKQLDMWRTDLYKSVEIKSIQISEEELLKMLVQHNSEIQSAIISRYVSK